MAFLIDVCAIWSICWDLCKKFLYKKHKKLTFWMNISIGVNCTLNSKLFFYMWIKWALRKQCAELGNPFPVDTGVPAIIRLRHLNQCSCVRVLSCCQLGGTITPPFTSIVSSSGTVCQSHTLTGKLEVFCVSPFKWTPIRFVSDLARMCSDMHVGIIFWLAAFASFYARTSSNRRT